MSNITTYERFSVIHSNRSQLVIGEHIIVKDNETGVLYYMIDASMSAGGIALTPLLDVDGKPVVDK